MHRFNESGPDGLTNLKGAGRSRFLNDEQMKELARIVEKRPDLKIDGVVRWRHVDLVRVIEERFAVNCSDSVIGKYLAEVGFSYISGRPQHPAQKAEVIDTFKKNFANTLAAHVADLPKGKPIELWFQDEARIGQKNGRVRIWGRKGTRPRLPADQRYQNTYLFGAICPRRGVGAALVLPTANTEAMQLHLTRSASMLHTKPMAWC